MYRALALFLILILGFTIASAQEDVLRPQGKPGMSEEEVEYDFQFKRIFYLGIEAGINYNLYSQEQVWNPTINQSSYRTFESGTGFSPYVALFIDLPISKKIGLQGKLAYDGKYFSDKGTGLLDGINDLGQFFIAEEEMDYSVSGAYVNVSVLLRYNITNRLFAVVGPTLGLPIGDFSIEATRTMLTEDAFYNLPGNPTVVESKGDFAVPTRTAIDFGLGYFFDINDKLMLVPQLRFQFGLSKFDDNEQTIDASATITNGMPSDLLIDSKALHSIQLTVALFFSM